MFPRHHSTILDYVYAMNEDLFQLIYTSEAAEGLTESGLEKILAHSRQKNALLDITGILLHSNGRFIQVLEGSCEAVLHLYERIQADQRHEAVRVFSKRHVLEREFAEWSMGFRQLSDRDLAAHPKVNDFFSEHFDSSSIGKAGSPAHFLLLAFRDVA
jgi:hypothetical protein